MTLNKQQSIEEILEVLSGKFRIGNDKDQYTIRRNEKIGRATSELQSHHDLVCRLLLEKKKNTIQTQKKKKNTQIPSITVMTLKICTQSPPLGKHINKHQ